MTKWNSALAVTAFSVLAASLATSAQASQVRREILNTAQSIEASLLDSDASEASLQAAHSKMREALALIQGTTSLPPQNSQACIAFAYSKYYIQQNSDAAMTNAIRVCKGVADLPTLQFLYEKFFIQQSATAAMDSAAAKLKLNIQGKLPVLQFSYEKYYIQQSATAALNSAVESTQKLGADALSCLRFSYDKFYQNLSATEAMRRATDACANP